MSLPNNLFSVAFKDQKLGFLLFLMMVIMVYVGSLAMAAQAMLARSAVSWGHDLEGRLTIEVPSSFREDPVLREQRGQKVLEALQKIEGIKEAQPITKKEMSHLLNPWIDDEKLMDILPLPYLIDVQLASSDAALIKDMEDKLKAVEETIKIHKHAGWMGSLMGFVRGLGWLASVMLFLTALSIITVVGIVCRAGLAVQQDTVRLLHYMGADDALIADAFQQHIKQLASRACLYGFLGAVATVFFLGLMLGVMGGLTLVAPMGFVTLLLTMALVPLVAGLLAHWTARITALRLLRLLE